MVFLIIAALTISAVHYWLRRTAHRPVPKKSAVTEPVSKLADLIRQRQPISVEAKPAPIAGQQLQWTALDDLQVQRLLKNSSL